VQAHVQPVDVVISHVQLLRACMHHHSQLQSVGRQRFVDGELLECSTLCL
jgi:hypothetical protein